MDKFVEEDPAEPTRAEFTPAGSSSSPLPEGTAKEFGRRTYIIANIAPLDIDGVRTVEVGTALWAIAFVALLPFVSSLQADGRLWWLWTCLAGVGLGLFGIDHCRRRRRQRSQD